MAPARTTPLLAVCLLALPAWSQENEPAPSIRLSKWESKVGWRLLYDGTETGWHGYGNQHFPRRGWITRDDSLYHEANAGGGDLVTDELFEDFELVFEWRVQSGANSGVKYRFTEARGGGAPLGPEYQVLDDDAHADGLDPKTSAAALYALYEPTEKRTAPAGEWNRARILSVGDRIEHWLNGIRVLETRVGSEDWNERVAASKFAGVVETFGKAVPAPIALQDHGDAVWYRDLRIRDPSNPPGELVPLFDGTDLTGWTALGDAIYEVDDGSILGRIGGGGQSFLATEREFGDFVLEVEVKTELPGNSGIQIRSRATDTGRLNGYQIEIDPSERAWSGGLYYEGGAWLQNLKENEPGRRAFRHGEWNRFRIECSGPLIRAWVNGVPTVDYAEAKDRRGVIGLQVHSGDDTRVRWRGFRLWELGE